MPVSPTSATDSTMPTARVRVWDLPTRLFHWGLVLSVMALVVTGQIGGNAIDWHAQLGVAVAALLLFRFVWGLVGGRWSRFTSFIYSPLTTLRYLRGQSTTHAEVGHNPLGALSVFALLAVLLAQVGSGLIIDDEIAFVGPLNAWAPAEWVSWASSWHRAGGKLLLIGLVVLHVAAIVFHAHVKRHNLVTPMLTGDKLLPVDTPASRDDLVTRGLALLLLAACAVAGVWLWQLGYANAM
jgi:cytochrome b